MGWVSRFWSYSYSNMRDCVFVVCACSLFFFCFVVTRGPSPQPALRSPYEARPNVRPQCMFRVCEWVVCVVYLRDLVLFLLSLCRTVVSFTGCLLGYI